MICIRDVTGVTKWMTTRLSGPSRLIAGEQPGCGAPAYGNGISSRKCCRCSANIAGSIGSAGAARCCATSGLMVLNARVVAPAAASMASMPPNKIILDMG